MDLKRLSLPQRLAAGCGCVSVLAALAALALFLLLGQWQQDTTARELATAPPGWMDSLRALARAPDLGGLTLPRTDDGDGAVILHAADSTWGGGPVEDAYAAIIGMRERATSEDSAAWRRTLADTTLDRFVAAARRGGWHALERLLAGPDTTARSNLLALRVPRYAPVRNVTRALVIRALMRQARGDRAGARADLGAATGIGEQVFRHEPSLIGSLVGRAAISSAARGWEVYAARTGDAALAARAAAVREWAARRPGEVAAILLSAPDSALVLAADTSLALGARAQAMTSVISAWVFVPRGFLFGPPGRVHAALVALAADSSDPDAARLAAITANTVRRMRWLGILALMKEAGYGRSR